MTPEPSDTDDVGDGLTPFVFEHAAIRGGVVQLAATSRAILACHDYPPPVSRALGELLAASVLLASTLKLDGSLVVQLRGDGPLRLLVVECTGDLHVRATAQWSADAVALLGPAATLPMLAGGPEHGRLTITLDPRDGSALYQGIVALEGDSIAASIEHYLATSEQLQSRMVLAVTAGVATGVLLQRLPSSAAEDEALWQAASAGLAAGQTALDHAAGATALLRALFPQHDVRVFPPRSARFVCKCSAERAGNALRIAGAAEIEAALAADGQVEVTCEYCGRQYRFGPAEARALFTGRPTRH